MSWQDIVIAGAQITFILALIPAIRKHSTLPLSTTSASFLASAALMLAIASLELWLAAAMSMIKTSMWGILALQSYRAEKR